MTDSEIIKCLEQAIDKYNKNEIFVDNMRLDKLSLDLINRQQAEYNNLLEQFRILDCECERLEKADENQKAEIERLKAHINEVADKVEDKMTYMSGCQNLIQTVKKIILGDKTPNICLTLQTMRCSDSCSLCPMNFSDQPTAAKVQEQSERLSIWKEVELNEGNIIQR